MTRTILSSARIATMAPGAGYGIRDDHVIGVERGRIAFVAARDAVPAGWHDVARENFGGRLLTPAPIDCHTHLVFGGNRAKEFEMRLEGASYQEIARAGGGIVSTVAATRALSEDELVESALPRLDALIAEGVDDYSRDQLDEDYRHFCFAGIVVSVCAAMLVKRTERGDRMFLTMLDRHAQHAADCDGIGLLRAR